MTASGRLRGRFPVPDVRRGELHFILEEFPHVAVIAESRLNRDFLKREISTLQQHDSLSYPEINQVFE